MSPKIVLFGATGYTGARVAEAMTRRGLRPVLAGRDRSRLAGVADRLGGLPTGQADASDEASVRALITEGDVLVSTVGPFTQLGDTVIRAAIAEGAIYFDSTGEPPFIRRVFEHHGPAAERTRAALLTAFGNDYVPGTLAAAMALSQAGAATASVHSGYFLAGGGGQGFSKGTLRSLAGVVLEPMYSWRSGELTSEPAGRGYRTFVVRGRPKPAISIGGTEQFALPRLAATGLAPRLREVEAYLGWLGPLSKPIHLGSSLTPMIARTRLLASGFDKLTELVVKRVAEEPSAAGLAATTSYFFGEARDEAGSVLASVALTAPEPYAITADLLAWAADRAAVHGVAGTGALDAVSAFGLDTLRAGAAEAQIRPV